MRANTRRPSTYEQAKAHVSHPKCRTSTVSTAAMAASSRALQRLTVRMIYVKYVLLEPRDIKRLLCGDGCGANLTPLRSALSGETFARFSHSTLSLYALSVAARRLTVRSACTLRHAGGVLGPGRRLWTRLACRLARLEEQDGHLGGKGE